MPSRVPDLTRRRVLAGAAALAMLGTTAACGRPAPKPDVEALQAQADRARSDAQLAADAAAAAPPAQANSLTTIAAERTAHGQALSDELARMTGAPSPSTGPSATSTSASAPGTTAAPAASSVVAALKQSADAAARSAAQLSGYRAGLLGSIAAACTAAQVVTLAGVSAS